MEIAMIKEGVKAPDFTLNDKDGNAVSLSDFLGKKVVLYFYPKDNTPGCTRQACAFAAAYESFRSADVAVIGISKDSVASHQKFAEKYDLPFVLLSDPERVAIESFGVWQEKKMCGKTSMGVVRTTFIIDENGIVEKVMEKVKPDTNAQEILEYLSEN
jgi:peroxiredoxin Q/BCP